MFKTYAKERNYSMQNLDICLKHGTVAEREQVFNFCVLCLADSMLIAEGRQGGEAPRRDCSV